MSLVLLAKRERVNTYPYDADGRLVTTPVPVMQCPTHGVRALPEEWLDGRLVTVCCMLAHPTTEHVWRPSPSTAVSA